MRDKLEEKISLGRGINLLSNPYIADLGICVVRSANPMLMQREILFARSDPVSITKNSIKDCLYSSWPYSSSPED